MLVDAHDNRKAGLRACQLPLPGCAHLSACAHNRVKSWSFYASSSAATPPATSPPAAHAHLTYQPDGLA
eukprot:6201541-Pleurochrysis_carterae.AAC.2